MKNTEIFAKRLKKLRTERNIPLSKLADTLGVSAQSLSFYENAKRSPNLEQLAKISEFFGVSADYLAGFSSASSPQTDIQAICRYIGIDDKAVENLRQINSSDTEHKQLMNEILSAFLSCGYFAEAMTELLKYRVCTEIPVRTSDEAETLFDKCDLHKYRAAEKLNKAAENTSSLRQIDTKISEYVQKLLREKISGELAKEAEREGE